MRTRCLSILVLVAVALGGCFQRGPQYVQYVPQAGAPMASAQVPAHQNPPVYQTPAQSAPASKGPTPRGFFAYNLSGPFAQAQTPAQTYAAAAPVHAAPPPVYSAPAPVYAVPVPVSAAPAPVYPPPAPVYSPPAPVYSPPPQAYAAPAPVYASPCGPRGCGAANPSSGYAAYPQTTFDSPYLLDAGDRLRITVFGQEGLTNSYAVDAAGNVTLPLVGTIPARGMTTDHLSYSISERLKQGYIREPKIAIEVEAYRPFFIHGEVTTPGQFAYVANMTVENAIAIAGGFGPRADRGKVTVSRTLNGQTTRAAVGLNYPLRPGDTLRIGERWF